MISDDLEEYLDNWDGRYFGNLVRDQISPSAHEYAYLTDFNRVLSSLGEFND